MHIICNAFRKKRGLYVFLLYVWLSPGKNIPYFQHMKYKMQYAPIIKSIISSIKYCNSFFPCFQSASMCGGEGEKTGRKGFKPRFPL